MTEFQYSNTMPPNHIDHNILQQEVAEPIPAQLIAKNPNPPQNNYLDVNFNYTDTEEPAACSQ